MSECAGCGRGIRGRPASGRQFCSSTCATDESPKVWDGKTLYGYTVQRKPYEACCMLCGRSTSHTWSDEEVRALRPWQCTACGGAVQVEPVPATERRGAA